MNVYDFDGTLYRGDSTADFLMWCLRRYPRALLTLPFTGIAAVGCFGLRVIVKTRFKGVLYRFLTCVPDIQREVQLFWRARKSNIQGPCRPKAGDLVISASPEFLLRDVCHARGLQLIASPVDPHTGRTLGPNCSGEQKIVRLRREFPDEKVDVFYSDSHNDDPMAGIAAQAFMVDIPHNKLTPW